MSIPFCDPVACPARGCEPVVCRGEALTNEQLFARATAVIPGGVSSPIRAYKAVGGTPAFVARASGGRVWDAEGTEYVDLVQSYGAIILGHAHPKVVEAITKAAADGTSYGAPTAREMKLAEAMCARVPGAEMIRLVNSGTEATMTAIRLARGATGRPKVLKFAGNYHGHGDMLLAASGSAVAVLGLPGSVGVTEATVSQTIVAPYNVVPTLDDTVAAVIVEPVAANMGLVQPVDGFLEGLRAECDRVGAVLIFDEVITGFRLGVSGAQGSVTSVTPDLFTWGKVIGGGLPIGAFGGRRDLMEQMAPVGPVFQAGTLSGNPLATAAGLAALDLLDEAAYEHLRANAAHLARAFAEAFAAAGVPVHVPIVDTLVGLHLSATPATDYASAKTTDEARYARFFHGMKDGGVLMAPGAYEVAFASLAHTAADLEHVAERAAIAAASSAS
jgi:glutamate-1-semialdehyde 2,1-aminomutase